MQTARITLIDSLDALDAATRTRLLPTGHPIVSDAFLGLMERTGVLEAQGWQSLHLAVYEGETCVGLMPMYVKHDSVGEFTNDWSWADAWRRHGQRYYPKLVTCVPFTPVTGPRLLLGDVDDSTFRRRAALLVAGARAVLEQNGLSSWHLLFAQEREVQALADDALLHARIGVQFHWFNRGYSDFDAFLAQFTSRRRKEIRRERRLAHESGLRFECLDGHSATHADWEDFHRFYCSTFERKWGEPRFTLDWFTGLAAAIPESTLLFMAREGERAVAGAFALRAGDTLYGRHWGCDAFYPHLHFELCYYQTIDYCIRHGLERLDAGAQGEHKLARGFEPVFTRSLHHVRDSGFSAAINDFCRRESAAVHEYFASAREQLPFREATVAGANQGSQLAD